MIGKVRHQTGARLYIQTGTTGYKLFHHNGTTSVSCELPGFPALGQLVRLRWNLYSDGSVRLFQSLDGGGVETSGAKSAANALVGAWADTWLWINSLGQPIPANSTTGFMAYRNHVVLLGSDQTLATMVSKL